MFKHVVAYLFVFSEGTGYLVWDECHITATVSLFPIFSLGTRVAHPNIVFQQNTSLPPTALLARDCCNVSALMESIRCNVCIFFTGVWKSGRRFPIRKHWHEDALTYASVLLTYSMVQSPSWEANWFAASQEIPRILWDPKVHYSTHKRPPPVPILGQPNPVHIPTSHLLEIHPNIHPSTPRSLQWSLSLRFPHQDPIHPPLLTHTRHMPSQSHSARFYGIDFPVVLSVLVSSLVG